MQQRDIFFASIFWSHNTNLLTPLGPMHPQNMIESILEGWLEKFRIFGLRCHSSNPLCSRFIFEAKSTLIRKNNIMPELSWPFSESPCLLKTICTVLYRNIRLPFPFKALKLVFVENFSHQRSTGTLVVVGPSYALVCPVLQRNQLKQIFCKFLRQWSGCSQSVFQFHGRINHFLVNI